MTRRFSLPAPSLYRTSLILLVFAALLSALMAGVSGCKNEVTPPPASEEKWRAFTTANSGLIDNYIYQISVDDRGYVWFATRNGAASFSNMYWGHIRDSLYTFTYESGGLVDTGYTVRWIAHAKDRAIWFALGGGGIMRYQPFSDEVVWKRFTSANGGFDSPLSLAADKSYASPAGEMWVTSVAGINRFVQSTNARFSGTWYSYRRDDNAPLPVNQVWVAAAHPADNTIWFGPQSGGPVVASYGFGNEVSWNYFAFPDAMDSKMNSISFDAAGTVWIGKDNGAAALTPGTSQWTEYTAQSTQGKLPAGRVNAVLADHQNVRWFGTDSGLVRLADTVWTRFTMASTPIPSDTITALQYDNHGNLWIGTPDGAAVYNEAGLRF